MGMEEVKFSGYQFTWSNNRVQEGFVEERLDRFFGSPGWMLNYPKAIVNHIARQASDHYLLLLDVNPEGQKSKKRFCFDQRWINMEGVYQVVEQAWNTIQQGSPMYQIQAKIKQCRLGLLHWCKGAKTNSAKQIVNINQKMEQISKLGGQRDWNEWQNLKKELNRAYDNEEKYWRNKSRVQWLKEGDKNTKFFQACVVQRRKINVIEKLVSRTGHICETPALVEKEVTSFYSELFTSSCPAVESSILEGIPRSIDETQKKWMTRPVGDLEIRQALFELHPNKAPGPDGTTWNEDLIRHLFNCHDAAQILKMPISTTGERDRLTWQLTLNGKFTVQSTYKALQHLRKTAEDIPESSEGSSSRTKLWKETWKMKIKGKIKHFLWRCFHNILPTQENLISRGLQLDPVCQLCGGTVENLEHILFHCERAQNVWKHAPISWEGIKPATVSFKDWWSHISSNQKRAYWQERMQLTAYLLWWLWKTRNLWIFERCKVSEKEIVDRAVAEWIEFGDVFNKGY